MDSLFQDFDEKREIEEVIKRFKKLDSMILPITKLKPNDPSAVEILDKTIKNISNGITISTSLEEAIIAAKEVIVKVQKQRIEKVKRHEAELINSLKDENVSVREINQGWRIGKLTLNLKPDIAKARILYNEQEVIPWEPVTGKESLINLLDKGNKKLEDLLIPVADLPEIVWDTYLRCSHIRGEKKAIIPVGEYFIELRLTIIKKMLQRNPGAKITSYLEFPLWAFLYNMDVYRSIAKDLLDGKRIGFQTGSQTETSANKGFTFGGLNPRDDFKIYCYIISLGG